MKENDGGPAFPVNEDFVLFGLSRRDYFAAKAMQGILAGPGNDEETTIGVVVECAFNVAEVMLRVSARRDNQHPRPASDAALGAISKAKEAVRALAGDPGLLFEHDDQCDYFSSHSTVADVADCSCGLAEIWAPLVEIVPDAEPEPEEDRSGLGRIQGLSENHDDL